MKQYLTPLAFCFLAACSTNGSSGNTSDTAVNATSGGISDGSNTILADTAHMDTSAGKIKK